MRYKITVEQTSVEETEVGRQYENTHKKDEKGEDIWGYAPSQFGKKEITRIVFQREVSAVDFDALGRVIARAEKKAAAAS